ncbi:hypothetical protein, partial [Enterobacter mori]
MSTSQAPQEGIASGQVHMRVGTHALVQEQAQGDRQGHVILDAEDSWGVQHRRPLWQKRLHQGFPAH